MIKSLFCHKACTFLQGYSFLSTVHTHLMGQLDITIQDSYEFMAVHFHTNSTQAMPFEGTLAKEKKLLIIISK